MSDKLNFEQALTAAKELKSIRRESWKEMVPSVSLKSPPRNTPQARLAVLSPLAFYQMKKNKDGSENRIPWLPSLDDLLCVDWVVL